MLMLCEFNLKEVVGEADGSFNIVSPATETEPLHRILWITYSQNNARPAEQTSLQTFFFFLFDEIAPNRALISLHCRISDLCQS